MVRRVLLYTAVALVAPAAHASDARFYLATRSVPDYVEPDSRGAALWGTVQSFYRARDYRLAWVQDGRMSAEAEHVAGMVARAETQGLDAYRVPAGGPQAVTATFNGAPGSDADAVWDVQLTYLFLQYAADLSGRFDPKAGGPFWLTRPPPRDLAAWLEDSLRSGHAGERFATLSPSHPAYRGLQAALERYRRIERDGGWPTLTPRPALRRGSRGPAVALLRRRLEVEGDLPSTRMTAAPDVYDSVLAEGVRRFERRHGLVPDGILDAAALDAMNVPVAARIRQIELNLERWRWLPAELGPRYVMVDLPSFQLTAYTDGRPAVTMKVVTGKADSPTPVFSNDMTTVVFSPYWNVPSTIAEDEIIPAVLRDPGYLRRHDLELFRGTQAVGPAALRGGDVSIRQRPGTRNALGLIKFVFPNPFGVYLHDTPSETLFARPRRAFSHGCIRVEKPRELAAWVLSGLPQWTPAAIGSAMRGGRERSLALPDPIPVHITYETVRADADGTVFFWPDVYGHDAAQMPLMPAHRALPPRPSTLGTVDAGDLTVPAGSRRSFRLCAIAARYPSFSVP